MNFGLNKKAVKNIEFNYNDYLKQILKSLFTYDFDEKTRQTLRTEIIEDILLENGMCAIWKIDKLLYATECFFTGKIDPNGFLSDVTCITKNGIEKTFKNWYNNPDVAIIFNDNNYTPDLFFRKTAHDLTNVDISLELNVINSRLKPVPQVKNEEQKRAVEQILNDTAIGTYKTIMNKSQNVQDVLGKQEIPILNLTDAKYSQHIQYLSLYKDDVLRWFLGMYGIGMATSGKRAQTTRDEIASNSESKMIIPCDMLNQRKLGIEMLNKKFGTSFTVDFSKVWKENREREERKNEKF